MSEERKDPQIRPVPEDTELMEGDLEQLEELLDELEEAVKGTSAAGIYRNEADVSADVEDGEEEEPEPAEGEEPALEAAEPRARPQPEEERRIAIPDTLPILPLKETVVYPLTMMPLGVGQERSIRLIDDAMRGNRLVGLVAQKTTDVELAGPDDTFRIGTAARIARMLRTPDGTIQVIVQGLERIRILDYIAEQPYLQARVEVAPEITEDGVELEALKRNAVQLFQRLVSLVQYLPNELALAALNIDDPRQVVYLIANSVQMDLDLRQGLLEEDSVQEKLRQMTQFLTKELEVLELGKKIQSQAQEEMGKAQREYFLREQLKAIQKELGEESEEAATINQLREQIEQAGMPEEALKESLRELSRLEKLPAASPEYSVIRTYLDILVSLPWNKSTGQKIDVPRARDVLDEDHYDLEKIKDRILEYLAVRRLKEDRLGSESGVETAAEDGKEEKVPTWVGREPILCFVGPPGVGKTSLGQSIARSLGRKFARMSLGGIHDESEIRGHRRTYIGALPGRIIQTLRRVGTNDPVMMLDEVDKVGADWRGDPSSALLEVLDPEQNYNFRDNYLDLPFDLSRVMFIATANSLDPIPPPLRDRMEILELSGYTEEQKVHIARRYLLPKQIKANGLKEDEISLDDPTIRRITREYTREAGVRNLEREIATVCRKVAMRIAEGKPGPFQVTADQMPEMLGRPRFMEEVAERIDRPGVVTGLAWTPVGGDILFIEVAMTPSRENRLILTGQLGDVMRESAQAALSYVESNALALGIDPKAFEDKNIHIHIPAGATPKDGPSAGVTMTTAIASLASGRKARSDVAMTGEISLRGKVLPIGGLKEKVLAAHRAGLKTIIMPKRNEPDLEDLPKDLREQMRFVPVSDVSEVLAEALEPAAPGDLGALGVEDLHRGADMAASQG